MKIGVIDSGIGGLTTLKCMREKIGAEYYYYMDNENVPYGTKSREFLEVISHQILENMLKIGVDIVVIACNTLSAVCGKYLRGEFSVPIVCIEPSIKPAYSTNKSTIVLATQNTINSDKFISLMRAYPKAKFKASKYLATYIEQGNINSAKNEVNKLLAGEICENVVLGCTHYVYLKEYVTSLGYEVFEGNNGVTNQVMRIISKSQNLHFDSGKLGRGEVHIHSSKNFDISFVSQYLKSPILFW